jgi:hypothetical protein
LDYITHSHYHAEAIIKSTPQLHNLWLELLDSINKISDEELIQNFETASRKAKSISESINRLLKKRLVAEGWSSESPLFQGTKYRGNAWRLDFAGFNISVEVAFNHGEATSWNLLKPVLASELNHVQKEIQTEIGIVITATQEMKKAGGFDSAVGTYEKFLTYLDPMRNVLTAPMMIIGLKKPETFYIAVKKIGDKNIGTPIYTI